MNDYSFDILFMKNEENYNIHSSWVYNTHWMFADALKLRILTA